MNASIKLRLLVCSAAILASMPILAFSAFARGFRRRLKQGRGAP
jgi:hypothetical protein